jgi:Tol biopolymer transport system component
MRSSGRSARGVAVRVAAPLVALASVLVMTGTAHATFPGANGKIAYVGPGPQGEHGIVTINPDRTGAAFVAQGFDPAWSPDGRRIAFARSLPVAPGVDSFDIYVVDADGSNVTRLTGGPGWKVHPSWSPDGTKIAFSSAPAGGTPDVYVMNADGTSVTRLTDSDNSSCGASQPDWSPDGDRIAFTACFAGSTGNRYATSRIGADGSDAVELPMQLSYAPTSPAWSPDADRLVMTSSCVNVAGSCAIGYPDKVIATTPDGTDPTEVVVLPPNPAGDPSFWSYVSGPTFSPDGAKIALISAGCFDLTGCSGGYYTVLADGTNDGLPGFGECCGRLGGAPFSAASWQPLVNQAPDCSGVAAAPGMLRRPVHDFRSVMLKGAADPDGDPVTIATDGVTQDEPVGRQPDAQAARGNTLYLRAERLPRGDGRVYRIAFTATDGGGLECSGEATVEVRRKKKKPAVDSAPPSYDSFVP